MRPSLDGRRVLLVSPRFPPKNAPDHHRIRMSLPYFRKFGWDAVVLCVSAETSDSLDDPALGLSLPSDARIVRIPAWSEAKCRRFGFGHLDYRCLVPLYRAAMTLLKREKFDVVFFSTTSFPVFLLGPLLKRRFGCKIVYDFQDPWFHGEVPAYTRFTWPGKWWKLRAGQVLARHGEAFSMAAADHVISVSEGYVSALRARYPRLRPSDVTVLPFGVAQADFDFMTDNNIHQEIFRAEPNRVRWVYAGRVGPDMFSILEVLFGRLLALKAERPDFVSRLDIQFVGTNYSPAERTFDVVAPIARRCGVADIVTEHSGRIPYFETLSLYCESDGILLIGADSGDYTASKLFNCVLSRKPVLALFHEASLVSRMAATFPSVFLCDFEYAPTSPEFRARLETGLKWLQEVKIDDSGISRQIEPWSAAEMTRVQCAIFDRLAAG